MELKGPVLGKDDPLDRKRLMGLLDPSLLKGDKGISFPRHVPVTKGHIKPTKQFI